jgi:hypothetical protein
MQGGIMPESNAVLEAKPAANPMSTERQEGPAAGLWVKQPEAEDGTVLAASLCGCGDVCIAPVGD